MYNIGKLPHKRKNPWTFGSVDKDLCPTGPGKKVWMTSKNRGVSRRNAEGSPRTQNGQGAKTVDC